MEEPLIHLINQYGLQQQVMIGSFSEKSLLKIRELNRNIPLVYTVLNDNVTYLDVSRIKQYAMAIAPNANQINKEFVERMHSEGLKVYVWFFHDNEQDLMMDILLYNVDGVFTDFINDTKEMIKMYTLKGIFIRKNKEYFCGKYYTNSEFIILPYLLNKKFTFGCLTQY